MGVAWLDGRRMTNWRLSFGAGGASTTFGTLPGVMVARLLRRLFVAD
jgi:hypothetical protein